METLKLFYRLVETIFRLIFAIYLVCAGFYAMIAGLKGWPLSEIFVSWAIGMGLIAAAFAVLDKDYLNEKSEEKNGKASI